MSKFWTQIKRLLILSRLVSNCSSISLYCPPCSISRNWLELRDLSSQHYGLSSDTGRSAHIMQCRRVQSECSKGLPYCGRKLVSRLGHIPSLRYAWCVFGLFLKSGTLYDWTVLLQKLWITSVIAERDASEQSLVPCFFRCWRFYFMFEANEKSLMFLVMNCFGLFDDWGGESPRNTDVELTQVLVLPTHHLGWLFFWKV